MNQETQLKPRLVLLFFIAQVFVNWIYILWIKSQPDIIINAWFVVLPLMGYFYFTFAFIASVGLFYGKQPGLTLGYGVLMFGMMADVITYNLIYRQHNLLEQLIIPLIAINLCVIFYMAYNQQYFKGQ